MKRTTVTGTYISALLARAWSVYVSRFPLILAIVAIVYIPVNITMFAIHGPDTDLSTFEDLREYWRVFQALEAFVGVIATIGVAYVAKCAADKETPHPREIAGFVTARYVPLLLTNLLLGVATAVAFILLVLPGFYFGTLWMFAPYAVMFRDIRYKGAMDYSRDIVRGRWWKIFGTMVTLGALSIVGAFIAGIPGWILPANNAIAIVFTDTLIDLALAYFIVAETLWFLDMDKTRIKMKE
jgi:hypothetical protein